MRLGASRLLHLKACPLKCYIFAVEQTITAPATPQGTSALAIIRVSGPEVRCILRQMFHTENPVPRMATLANVCHPETHKNIDSAVFIFYAGPQSYTGEDSLEVFPHGNPLIVRQLLEALCTMENVRIAYPGEFTKRAFLNGKMDLVQAESVADVIHSQTVSALDNAHKLLSGKFSTEIRELSRQLKNLFARIELDVDFVEEEADPDVLSWKGATAEIRRRVQNLIAHFKNSGVLNRKPKVVLYGAPNAGKSSLLNALLRENRVLVSDVPGTTRDFIEVSLPLPSGEVTLIDTAGIADKFQSDLDRQSMEKSATVIESADLAIFLADATQRNSCELNSQMECAKANAHWVVYSKMDLVDGWNAPEGALAVSSKNNTGLSELIGKLDKELFPQGEAGDEYWITSERECAALRDADAGLERVQTLLEENPAVELIAFEMRGVLNALSSIVGEISSEDVLQTIFSGFCIGK